MADEKAKEQDNKETKKETSTSKAVEKLVDEIAKLSVMELSELVNALQDKLGVTAAAPVAAPSASSGQVADAAPAAGEEAGGGTVVITGVGENKIAAIKAIREIDQNITLKDAKDMTENLPAEVLKDAKADEAKAAVEKLKAAGCTVEVK